MQGDEARLLLGFPPNSRPTPSQIKAAYRKKVWSRILTCFQFSKSLRRSLKFKLIAEAYTCLQSVPCYEVLRDWLVEPKKQAMLEDEVQEEVHIWVISCWKSLATMFSFFDALLRHRLSSLATYSHVVRTVPKAHGGRKNRVLIQIPFLIVLGSVGLGGLNTTS